MGKWECGRGRDAILFLFSLPSHVMDTLARLFQPGSDSSLW